MPELGAVSFTLNAFILVADAMIMSGSMIITMIAVAAILALMNAMVMLAMRERMASYAFLFFNQSVLARRANQQESQDKIEIYSIGLQR